MLNAIQYNCTGLYQWTIVVLEMGVQWKVHGVCMQEPLGEPGGFGISHSACEIRKRKRMWTATGKGSGLVVDEQPDITREDNNNVLSLTSVGEGRS